MTPHIRQRLQSAVLATLLACPVLQGCTENPFGIPLSDLAGVYTGTKFEFRSVAGPATTFDLVADSNVTIDWNVDSEGTFAMGFHIPGNDDAFQGTIVIVGDGITVDGLGPISGTIEPVSGTFTLNGAILTIHGTAGAEFDFDGDGIDEPARLQMVFSRTQTGDDMLSGTSPSSAAIRLFPRISAACPARSEGVEAVAS